MPISRRAAPATTSESGLTPTGEPGVLPAKGFTAPSTVIRRLVVRTALAPVAGVAFIVPNGAIIWGGVHSGVGAGTVGVGSTDRPAKARGEAIHSFSAAVRFANRFVTTSSVLVCATAGWVNVSTGEACASTRSVRALRRSRSDEPPVFVAEPPVLVVACTTVLSASPAFSIASEICFAASDSLLTIDVAVFELGVVSSARWRPTISDSRGSLRSTLPKPAESLSCVVVFVPPSWPAGAPVPESSPSVACATPAPVKMAVPTPRATASPPTRPM